MVSPIKTDALQLEILTKANQADHEAKQLKKNYNIVWKSTIVFGLLVAVFFAINASFHTSMDDTTSAIFTVLEFAAFVGVVTVITISKKRQSHLRFITQRLKAEKLRLINTYYNANIPIELRELRSNNDEELTELIDRTGQAIADHGYTSTPFSFYWIKNLIENQLNYHVSFLFSRVSNRIHKYERIIRMITLAFVVNVILAFTSFLIHYFHWNIPFHYPHFLAIFAGIVLPAGFAAMETILYFREWNMLKKNSSHMADFLKEREEQFIEHCRQGNPKELLDEISVKMLTDNKNWDYIIRGKPNEVKLF
jgi:hypothetical protein